MPHRTRTRPPIRLLASKKRTNRKRRDWASIVTRIGCLVLCAEILWFLFLSPIFRVHRLRIVGQQTLSADQIASEAKIKPTDNLLLTVFNPHVTARVCQDPVVDTVTASLSLPRTLILHVVERQPFVQLRTSGGLWLVDFKRVPYKKIDHVAPGVPILQLSGQEPENEVILGHALNQYWMLSGLALLQQASAYPVLNLGSVKVDQNANLCLNSKDHFQVKFGQPDGIDLKIAVAVKALEADSGRIAREALYVDVSSPNQPVWRPQPKGQTGNTGNGTLSGIQ